MTNKKVSVGQMWKSEQGGEVFVVTSLYKDVLASFAMLRPVSPAENEPNKRARIVRTNEGELIDGFRVADQV